MVEMWVKHQEVSLGSAILPAIWAAACVCVYVCVLQMDERGLAGLFNCVVLASNGGAAQHESWLDSNGVPVGGGEGEGVGGLFCQEFSHE